MRIMARDDLFKLNDPGVHKINAQTHHIETIYIRVCSDVYNLTFAKFPLQQENNH